MAYKKTGIPTGRPTKYDAERTPKEFAEYMSVWKKNGDMIPTIAGLSLHLEISMETVQAWRRDSDKKIFSVMLRGLLAIQHKTLVEGGLDGTMNSTICKLVLSKHGYSERLDIREVQREHGDVSEFDDLFEGFVKKGPAYSVPSSLQN